MVTTPSSTSTSSVALQAQLPGNWSLADLQEHLGGISAERIRLFPPPGYAREEDVIRIETHEDRLYELQDGILVEKAMGWYESMIAMLIGIELGNYLRIHDLGKVLGADGTIKLQPGKVKIPDVSFISWERWPKEGLPRRPIPALVPDLVVEVLSETNTEREMDQKLKHYFEAGVRLVWYIDAESRSARTFTSPSTVCEIPEGGLIKGGDVLPGFELSLRELFDQADRQGPRE